MSIEDYILEEQTFPYLHVQPEFISAISTLNEDRNLLVLADHNFNEVIDEFRLF